MVKAKDISYEYSIRDEDGNITGIKKALDNLSVEVKHGEFVAILGRNGSGKSTFAKHLNALLYPTEGCVWIDGMNTNDENLIFNIRSSCGMIFQNPDNQIIASTVEEDVAFAPENLGVEPQEMRKRVIENIEAVGLKGLEKKSPNILSGGQKQSVSLAGILAMQPKCIVLDEPTAMLDPKGRDNVINIINKLHSDKKMTIILITHYPEETLHCDKIFIMDEGRIIMKGRPEEVYADEIKINKTGLKVPFTFHLVKVLRENGIDIPVKAYDTDELCDVIAKRAGL